MRTPSNAQHGTNAELALIIEPDATASARLAEAIESFNVRPLACGDAQQCARVLGGLSHGSSIGEVVAIVASVGKAFDPRAPLVDVIAGGLLWPPVVLTIDSPLGDCAEAAVRHAFFGLLPAPFSLEEAQREIASAITEGRQRAEDRRTINDFRSREAALNHDEQVVLQAVCEGKLNKQIAREQNISVRTVEQRRRRVFTKMGVSSAAPLAQSVAVARTLQRLHAPQTHQSPAVLSNLTSVGLGNLFPAMV